MATESASIRLASGVVRVSTQQVEAWTPLGFHADQTRSSTPGSRSASMSERASRYCSGQRLSTARVSSPVGASDLRP